MRKTNAELLHTISKRERELAAFKELFHCDGIPRVAVPLSQTVTAVIHGATRAAGGVVVTETGPHGRQYPRFLDDLVEEWRQSPDRAPRDAAEAILAARDRAVARKADMAAELAAIRGIADRL